MEKKINEPSDKLKTPEETPAEKDTSKKEKKVFKAGLVDTTDLLDTEAKLAAQKNLSETKEQREENRVTKFFRRVWKGNIMKEYYEQREIFKKRKDILESGNLYQNETADKKFSDEALGFVVERFVNEHSNEMLTTEEKESLKKASPSMENDLKDLIKKYATDTTFSKNAFEEEKNRILSTVKTENKLKPKMYADNLLQIAEEIKKSIAEGESLEGLDFDLDLTLAEAKESLKTKEQLSYFDKALEKLSKNPIASSLVNETTISIAASVWALSGKLATAKAKMAAVATMGAGLVVSGSLAAAKENFRLKKERSQHIREKARGMEFNESDMKRREEMEKNRYDTIDAKTITTTLKEGLEKIKNGSLAEQDLDAVLSELAAVETRIELGDTQKIDLIGYSNYSTVEKERFELDKTRAELKMALKKAGFEGYENKLSSLSSTIKENLDKETRQKDATFQKLKTKRMALVFAKTFLIGGASGVLLGEVKALFSDKVDGLIETGLKKLGGFGGERTTNASVLESMRRQIMNDAPNIPFGNGHIVALEDHMSLNLPEGTDLIKNTDGTFNIMHGSKIIASNVPIEYDQNGIFSENTQNILTQNGISTETVTTNLLQEEQVSAQEYINKNIENMKKISRTWLGNDTEMYEDPNNPGHKLGADLNEIRGQWGGIDGTGLNENGDYVFNCKTLTDDGSFLKNLSIEAQKELQAGNLKVLLSITKGTQNFVFEFPIDTDGNAIIDKTSEAGKILFEVDEKGHAIFKGAFAELAKSTGIGEDGVEHMQIIGTLEGMDKIDSIGETIEQSTSTTRMLIPDTEMDIPPLVTAFARRPLEQGEYKDPVELKKEEERKQKEAQEKIDKEKKKKEEAVKKEQEAEKQEENTTEEKTENETLRKLFLESKTKKEVGLNENIELIRARNDLENINKNINSKFSNFKEEDFASEYARNIFKEIQKDPELNKDGLKNMGDLLENKLSNTEVKKIYSYKDITKEIPLLKQEKDKAFNNKENSIFSFIENKLNSLEKNKIIYEKLMSEYREELKEAENSRKEEKVLEIEEKIRILEKEDFEI
jgi:hypothetical protein